MVIGRFLVKIMEKEEIVNIEKFNKNNFAEETLKESEEYYVLEDYLIFL